MLIRERTQITRQLIEKLPRLKLIAQTGKIGSHVDVTACTERALQLLKGGLASSACRADLGSDHGSQPSPTPLHRQPQTWSMAAIRPQTASMPPNFGIGCVLRGKTLGIWGYGRIGQLVAGYGRAFGMNVRIWGREASRAKALTDGYQAASTREEFCPVRCYFPHLRLNDDTRNIVSLEDLHA